MKQKMLSAIFILLFPLFGVAYYYKLLGESTDIDKTFLTLSTFLFALFTGFFISRQASRYGEIRRLTADFDGNMSGIYRLFQHLGKDAQHASGGIIKEYYKKITKNGWDYSFTHKTTTITDLHALLEKTTDKNTGGSMASMAASRIIVGLQEQQKTRKNLVTLREERIPGFQWMLICILTAILVLTVSAIPSAAIVLGSAVKAAFIVSILVVVALLKQLDNLTLFTGAIGEHSARDVVEIIEGKK
ncbi:MAG: hypothetical protein HYT31_04720 [Parcubacteria group bacterium]|nr:hypothetical protein [Parcubacteria group bacterium]